MEPDKGVDGVTCSWAVTVLSDHREEQRAMLVSHRQGLQAPAGSVAKGLRFAQQLAWVPETTHGQESCCVSLSESPPGHGTFSSASRLLCHTPTRLATEHRHLC